MDYNFGLNEDVKIYYSQEYNIVHSDSKAGGGKWIYLYDLFMLHKDRPLKFNHLDSNLKIKSYFPSGEQLSTESLIINGVNYLIGCAYKGTVSNEKLVTYNLNYQEELTAIRPKTKSSFNYSIIVEDPLPLCVLVKDRIFPIMAYNS